MSGRLFELLRERMEGESVGLDESVTIAELHKRLLPYHACRDAFQFATKAEYDLELLQLLGDEDRLEVSEEALVEAVLAESRQVEPGLGFLQRFAASEIRLKNVEAPPAAEAQADEAESAESGCRSCGHSLPDIEGARYCPACGTDQVIPTCSGCDAELGDDWRYCALCGILIGS
jgi:rubrerythrin